jgi:hypothetical protein
VDFFNGSVTRKLPQSANSFDQIFFVLIPKVKHKLLSVTSQGAFAEIKFALIYIYIYI